MRETALAVDVRKPLRFLGLDTLEFLFIRVITNKNCSDDLKNYGSYTVTVRKDAD